MVGVRSEQWLPRSYISQFRRHHNLVQHFSRRNESWSKTREAIFLDLQTFVDCNIDHTRTAGLVDKGIEASSRTSLIIITLVIYAWTYPSISMVDICTVNSNP
jgi:hypothetical protein